MKNLKINNLEKSNQNSYDDLIISIEAGQGNLNLLLAVCDEFNYRSQLIEKYEQELININIRPFRTNLNLQDPSLYQALLSLYQSEDYLQQRKKAVITVLGITDLLALKLGESRSKLEIFIDYLQYTREGLRDFPFPIVLWLTNTIHDQIAQRAVDFYSWRKGVFFFSSSEIATVQSSVNLSKNLSDSTEVKEEEIGMLKIEYLQDLIAHKKGKPDGSLATLYSSLGYAYQQKLDQGKSSNYQRDVHEAITAYKKAIEIQTTLNSPLELATSLNNLALLYKSQGRYSEAEPLLVRALAIYEEQLGANHPSTATSLNNLALFYEFQGQLKKAEEFAQRALNIRQSTLGNHHPNTISSLLTVKGVQMQMVLGCDGQTLKNILEEIAQGNGITELNEEIALQLLEFIENNPPLIEIIKQRLSLLNFL
jgi:tetratricopeptide (TPR) repeat protein